MKAEMVTRELVKLLKSYPAAFLKTRTACGSKEAAPNIFINRALETTVSKNWKVWMMIRLSVTF